jgi:hypothetical protein
MDESLCGMQSGAQAGSCAGPLQCGREGPQSTGLRPIHGWLCRLPAAAGSCACCWGRCRVWAGGSAFSLYWVHACVTLLLDATLLSDMGSHILKRGTDDAGSRAGKGGQQAYYQGKDEPALHHFGRHARQAGSQHTHTLQNFISGEIDCSCCIWILQRLLTILCHLIQSSRRLCAACENSALRCTGSLCSWQHWTCPSYLC